MRTPWLRTCVSSVLLAGIAFFVVGGALLLCAMQAAPKLFFGAIGPDQPGWQRAGMSVVGAGVILVGLYLVLGDALQLGYSDSGLPRNPVPSTTRSREIGKAIYDKECAVCHAADGVGDRSKTSALRGDLDLSSHVLAHSSGQLYVWITGGLGSDMPAYGDQLSEEEVWHIVNYIRTFGNSSFWQIHAH